MKSVIPRLVTRLGVIAILALAYFFAGKLGLQLAFVHQSATAVWPPTGIALAAFLTLGYGVWPGVLLGAFLVNVTTAGTVWTSLGIAVGNTLEGLLGSYLVNRYANGCNAFDRPQDVFKFAALAGVVSTTVAATCGVTSLAVGGFARWADYGSIWFTWWIGDAVGGALVAPALVLWGLNPRLRWDPRRAIETTLLLTTLLLVGFVVFSDFSPVGGKNSPMAFLCIPILMWAAFRFGPRGAVSASLLLSGIAVWATVLGLGPFARESANESLLLLQAFMGVVALMALAVAAVVSQQARAERERSRLLALEQSARLHAERLSRLKDEFLATLSHELRTPLSAILGWAGLLRSRRLDESNIAQAVEVIERNAKAQARLIEQLLDVSRIVTGKLQLNTRRVEIEEVIQAAIDTLRPAAAAKNIRLTLSLDQNIGTLLGDPDRLRQVLWNLVSNAIKFTPREGSVKVLLHRTDSHAEIAVSDSGEGIDPEFLPHMFDRFSQANSSTTRGHAGLGLGLSIVRHLVELHGGTVSAQSAGRGQGAAFIVRLPLAPPRLARRLARVEAGSESSAEDDSVAPVLEGLQALVVEDEPDMRELLARVLKESGAAVIPTSSTEEALAALERCRPDVLISDIGMPEQDGYTLIQKVRNLEAQIQREPVPAIALTAYARAEDRDRALEAGYQVHLPKPIEPGELIGAVARLAGR